MKQDVVVQEDPMSMVEVARAVTLSTTVISIGVSTTVDRNVKAGNASVV